MTGDLPVPSQAWTVAQAEISAATPNPIGNDRAPSSPVEPGPGWTPIELLTTLSARITTLHDRLWVSRWYINLGR